MLWDEPPAADDPPPEPPKEPTADDLKRELKARDSELEKLRKDVERLTGVAQKYDDEKKKAAESKRKAAEKEAAEQGKLDSILAERTAELERLKAEREALESDLEADRSYIATVVEAGLEAIEDKDARAAAMAALETASTPTQKHKMLVALQAAMRATPPPPDAPGSNVPTGGRAGRPRPQRVTRAELAGNTRDAEEKRRAAVLARLNKGG